MKIVVVMPYLKSMGGASRYGWELSEYLASCGDEVILVSLYTDKTNFSTKENIRIVDLADEKSLTQSIKFIKSMACMNSFLNITTEVNFIFSKTLKYFN